MSRRSVGMAPAERLARAERSARAGWLANAERLANADRPAGKLSADAWTRWSSGRPRMGCHPTAAG